MLMSSGMLEPRPIADVDKSLMIMGKTEHRISTTGMISFLYKVDIMPALKLH